jgi:hydroxyacylglutathione hydrolase
VLIERSTHPAWSSNAYVVGDETGGTAVFVDSGAPLEPLLAAVERERLTPTHLLTTHGHPDHTANDDALVARLGVEIVRGDLETGGLQVRALPVPGHAPDGLAFLVNETVVFTGDELFRDSVGGARAVDTIRRSVMEVLMALPPEVRVLAGHGDETTIGREWEENPFVRVWRGGDPELAEPVRVAGEPATLVIWSPDHDGKGKGLVRFPDGREAIVGGSRIDRG